MALSEVVGSKDGYVTQVRSMKESPRDWACRCWEGVHLCFYLWSHKLKGSYEGRASGGYSEDEMKNKANRGRAEENVQKMGREIK